MTNESGLLLTHALAGDIPERAASVHSTYKNQQSTLLVMTLRQVGAGYCLIGCLGVKGSTLPARVQVHPGGGVPLCEVPGDEGKQCYRTSCCSMNNGNGCGWGVGLYIGKLGTIYRAE
jgi:hypothetical protein